MKRPERPSAKRRFSWGKKENPLRASQAKQRSIKKKKKLPPATVALLCAAGALLLVVGAYLSTRLVQGLLGQEGPGASPAAVSSSAPGTSLGPWATPAPDLPEVGENRLTLREPSMTPQPEIYRNLSHGSSNLRLSERHINQPSISGNEIFYSAGTGRLDSGPVLTKLCLYNLETQTEETIKTTELYNGSYYETLINEKWLVWLETDHGVKNYICVRNRETGEDSVLKTCENGKPKLRLSGDILIWMEQTEETLDRLYMIDLVSQENVALFSFRDVATYGVSAPDISGDYITWSGPDPEQTEEERAQGETSGIFWVDLNTDVGGDEIEPNVYRPGTYVHEPHFDGENFIWIDSNKSFNSNLYFRPLDGEATVIAQGVTTYALGDGIVVYGKDEAVWVYVIETGETCRLTSANETGIMPTVQGRTVVWDTTSVDGENRDLVRYKVLTDEDLYPLGREEPGVPVTATPTSAPTAEVSPSPSATLAAETTPGPSGSPVAEASPEAAAQGENDGGE